MADKTYKQWYDYHIKELRKNKNVTKYASEDALKRIAADQAQRSFDAQEKAKKNAPGNIAGPAPVPTPTAGGRVGRDGVAPTPAPTPAITKNPLTVTPTPALTTGGRVPANAADPNTYNNRMQSRIAHSNYWHNVSNPAPSLSATVFFTLVTTVSLAKVLKI